MLFIYFIFLYYNLENYFLKLLVIYYFDWGDILDIDKCVVFLIFFGGFGNVGKCV